MKWKLIAMLALLGSVACSSTPEAVGNVAHGEPKPTNTSSIEAKQVAAEQEAAYVVEIEFTRKSSALSRSLLEKLNALYKSVPHPDRIKEAKIVVWADQEYPSADSKKLDDDQIKLADRRGEVIKRFFKEKKDGIDVDIHNMAKRPGTVADWLGSEDARIKNSLERTGIATTTDKATSKARRAIVMILMNEKRT